MEERYLRNRIYISKEEQDIIKNYPILIGGCGIGSNIAECLLRLGFENLTIIDGDIVELSNLNRQNYTHDDINNFKADSLYKRLISINPKANIKVISNYITQDNLDSILEEHLIAVNALDFTNNIPILFDKKCQEKEIYVVHPYNLGWGGLVIVIPIQGMTMDILSKKTEDFNELEVVEYVSSHSRFWGTPKEWLEDIIIKYKGEDIKQSPPQLSIGSWIVAGMCVNVIYNIATRKKVKMFPQYYLKSILDD